MKNKYLKSKIPKYLKKMVISYQSSVIGKNLKPITDYRSPITMYLGVLYSPTHPLTHSFCLSVAIVFVLGVIGLQKSFAITVSGDTLAALAVSYVKERLPEGDWKVVSLNVPPNVSLSDSQYKVEIALPRGIKYKGATFAWVKIVDGVKPTKRLPVNLKVRALKPMIVASRRIGKHKILTKEDIHIEPREIVVRQGCRDALRCVSTVQHVIGKRTRKVISTGQAVGQDMLELVPLVEKGESVNVRLESRSVLISTKGISTSDGWLNDIINVRVSSKIISAKVISERCVIIN